MNLKNLKKQVHVCTLVWDDNVGFNKDRFMDGSFNVCVCVCLVHTYGTLLESDLTYIPLRPDQMDNGGMDISLDEDTSSMDDLPQKSVSKPQKKTKGDAAPSLPVFSYTIVCVCVCVKV